MSSKRRTRVLLSAPVAPVPPERRSTESGFLLTINTNDRCNDINSPAAKALIARYTALGDFLLKKRNILKYLKFLDKKTKEGQPQIILSREEHLSRVYSINEDRGASVEIGSKYKYIHLHVSFNVTHSTYVQVNKDYLNEICSVFLGKPYQNIHVNIRGSTLNKGYGAYINKNQSEEIPLPMHNFVSEFYKE